MEISVYAIPGINEKIEELILEKEYLEFNLPIEGFKISPDNSIVTIDKILKTVSRFYGVTEESLLVKCREREITQKRFIIMYFCVILKTGTTREISTKIGSKNRSLVTHAKKTICNLIEYNKKLSSEIEELERLIKISNN